MQPSWTDRFTTLDNVTLSNASAVFEEGFSEITWIGMA